MRPGKKEVRTFDLFCGAGGSSRGAVVAGATPVAALDMWDLAIKTYNLNFPESLTYRMKARSLSPHRVAHEVGRIDLLLASPECTNHSIARGNKPRCDDSRNTAFEVIRFAKVLRPRWVVVENVLQMRSWARFKEWHGKLRAIGYKTNIGILDAQFYRTPQSRRRLFVVGDLEADPRLPEPGQQTKKTVASILTCGETKDRPWGFTPVKNQNRATATVQRAERAIKALGDSAEFVMVYYGTDAAGGFQTLDRPLRTITTLDRFAYVRRNGCGHEMRMLQPPELAAAMGFPREHSWPDSTRRDKIKLIGNAVCPQVMRDVVATLVNNGPTFG
jgi:DNA (cytosine-5)-methyltransferase 1